MAAQEVASQRALEELLAEEDRGKTSKGKAAGGGKGKGK
jgi:hypothetical protein